MKSGWDKQRMLGFFFGPCFDLFFFEAHCPKLFRQVEPVVTGDVGDRHYLAVVYFYKDFRAFQFVPVIDAANLHASEQEPAQKGRISRLAPVYAGQKFFMSAKVYLTPFTFSSSSAAT